VQKINLKTAKKTELVDITRDVQEIVSKAKLQDGVCFVFTPHTTAGLTINENADPSVRSDIVDTFNKLIPVDAGYKHSEGNSDSHVKSSLFGFRCRYLWRKVLWRWAPGRGYIFVKATGRGPGKSG
jgi:secondary thiamine-phosphate synthase enzyme